MNKIVGVAIGVGLMAGAVALTVWDYKNTVYECYECGEIYKPMKAAYLLGTHTPQRRFMKCPYCNSKNWHYRKRK